MLTVCSEVTHNRYTFVGALEGKEHLGFMNEGQVSGLIEDVPSVEELFDKNGSRSENAAVDCNGRDLNQIL